MEAIITIPEEFYNELRRHLFKGRKEQGAFLFAADSGTSFEINLTVQDIYLVKSIGWDVQESFYLELNEQEKVKVMITARNKNCNLVECHSHRSIHEMAQFSPSDVVGLEQFVSYVRWKLPGKKYAALVWTKLSVYGQLWHTDDPIPIPVREIRIIKKDGRYKIVKPSIRERFFNWSATLFKRGDK